MRSLVNVSSRSTQPRESGGLSSRRFIGVLIGPFRFRLNACVRAAVKNGFYSLVGLYSTVESMQSRSSNPGLAFLLHIACCGGPLLIIAGGAGALALKAGLAIVVAVAAITGALTLWARRNATCPAPNADRDRNPRKLEQPRAAPSDDARRRPN